ncbi:MAG TPA: hypothetical protein VMW52_03800 [Phycisphaerae bacterium]|nr:hypothetical protein [Phycisphaerae bacterium]
MPICSDPTARWSYTLQCDKDKPPAERPRFMFRYMTRREKREYARLGEDRDALALMDGDAATAALYAAFKGVLVGWDKLVDPDGLAVPFDPEKLEALDGVLTDRELWLLYYAAQNELTGDDLKNSESRRNSSTDESAADAPAAGPAAPSA